jgi:hypothetical protein
LTPNLWREEFSSIFEDTILTAAEQLKISPLAVEKDYWVCEALRAICEAAPDHVVFKGGTSLEKLRIIKRFSEDLDLLIVNPGGSAKKLMKGLCQEAAIATSGQLSEEKSGGEPGWYWRQAYLEVPMARHGDVRGIADSSRVLLELGETGGPNPHSVCQIESLLARELAAASVETTSYDDLRPFSVQVLEPVRTLMEKLLRINNFLLDGAKHDGWPRIGRQLYDIYALLGDARVLERLNDKPLIIEIIDSARSVSAQIGRPDAEVPAGGFGVCKVFDAGYEHYEVLKSEHAVAMDALYYGSDPPSFEVVMDRISDARALLDPYGS